MNLRACFVALLLTGLMSLALVSEANACSCAFVANWGFLADTSGALPRNASGLVWQGHDKPEARDFGVIDLGAGGKGKPRAIPFELLPIGEGLWLVRPGSALPVGHTVRFATTKYNNFRQGLALDGTPPMAYLDMTVVDEELRLTDADLKLEASPIAVESLRVARGASCSGEIQVPQSKVRLVLPEAAEKFRQLLVFTTLVDGKPGYGPRSSLCSIVPAGRSWKGVGEDVIFAGCGQDGSGLSEGAHTVAIQATFHPTEPKAAVTAPVKLDLSCKGASPPAKGARFFP